MWLFFTSYLRMKSTVTGWARPRLVITMVTGTRPPDMWSSIGHSVLLRLGLTNVYDVPLAIFIGSPKGTSLENSGLLPFMTFSLTGAPFFGRSEINSWSVSVARIENKPGSFFEHFEKKLILFQKLSHFSQKTRPNFSKNSMYRNQLF